MNRSAQSGIVHLALPIVLILVVIVVFILVSQGIIKNPLGSFPGLSSTETEVSLTTDYKNPFDKDSQYVNPFDQYKSPMLNLKK